MKSRSFVLPAVVVLLACSGLHPATGPEHERELITADEIESVHARDAYDAIVKLRGNFLSYRGRTSLAGTSSPEPLVYVDDQAYGPISSLRTIPSAQIEAIRLYRAWEATAKFGTGHMGGVIAIETRH